jgi:lipopolysaccharide/colanic/teichoic acid biosynthesis glycosyltransferase
MNLAAHVWPSDADGPYEIPEQVRRISDHTNWDTLLPDHAETASWRVQQRVKRGVDMLAAGLALVVLSPLFLLIAAVIKLSSPGPVFYEWRVLGKRAKPFTGYKFRTMVVGADRLKDDFLDRNEMSGPVFKIRNDPRVTPLGRWLRKYSIDELPQLWSVLKGDMSLVGPRPPAPEEFVRFVGWQRAKLAVTPGITCLWQVSGRNEISDFDTWARLDLEYIQNWDLRLDAKILLKTIPAVLSARGAC